jgi:hypothetical protein
MTLDSSLVGMEALQEVIECAFYTAPLAGTIPISIMLVGPPGTGKSKAILQFKCVSTHVTNDVTSSGLFELLEDDKQGTLRHLLIPDFNLLVSHKASTSNLTIASLLTVMSEGIVRVDDGRRKKEIVHAPIGIVTAMTREIYEEHARKFSRLGVARRFCSLFFNYSYGTRDKVQTEIANGFVTLQQLLPRQITLPDPKSWPLTLELHNNLSGRIKELSREMAENMSWYPKWGRDEETGNNFAIKPYRGTTPMEFTPHMILRTMARGHALKQGRDFVTAEDVDFLIRFVSFTNYAMPVQL